MVYTSLQALDQEAIIKCRQLGVYEPPGLAAGDVGLRANMRRALWRWRCVGQVWQLIPSWFYAAKESAHVQTAALGICRHQLIGTQSVLAAAGDSSSKYFCSCTCLPAGMGRELDCCKGMLLLCYAHVSCGARAVVVMLC